MGGKVAIIIMLLIVLLYLYKKRNDIISTVMNIKTPYLYNIIQVSNEMPIYNIDTITLKPLDLLLATDSYLVCCLIKIISIFKLSDISDYIFSHVGIIVNSDVIDHPLIEKDKFYVLESSGYDNIPDIFNNNLAGVRICEFKKYVELYKGNSTNAIFAVARLNTILDYKSVKNKLTEFIYNIYGLGYNYNALKSIFVVNTFLRKFYQNNYDKMVCTELAINIYKYLGLYPQNVNSSYILPQEMIHKHNNKRELPLIFKYPLIYFN